MTTVEDRLAKLTSAEAGFLYAAGCCERLEDVGRKADEIAAGPLRAVVDEVVEATWEEVREVLAKAGFEQWWKRGAVGACEDRRRVMAWAKRIIEERSESGGAKAATARRALDRALGQLGGDLSPRSDAATDLRPWLKWEERDAVGARLVVVGGVLAGALKQAAIRRRVASLLHQLPPTVHDRVRRGLERLSTLDESVERRVYEVYRRMAESSRRPDEELAVIGLFFVVNAYVFRQNAALDRLECMLPERLRERCRAFRRACVRSRKPELSVAVAETLRAMEGGTEVR